MIVDEFARYAQFEAARAAAGRGGAPRQARADRLVLGAVPGNRRRAGPATDAGSCVRAGARQVQPAGPAHHRFPGHGGLDQWQRLARGGVRRHLPRRHLPSGLPDHLRRAGGGRRPRLQRRRPAQGDHRRLRDFHPHRRGGAAFALPLLPHHRHRRLLRQRGGHSGAGRGRQCRRHAALAGDGGVVRLGAATGLPLRRDDQGPACRPRGLGGRDVRHRRGQRHHRRARHPGRGRGLRRRDGRPAEVGTGDRRPGFALQHPGHHAEEPRLLRPHLRRDRRHARHPGAGGRSLRRRSSRFA